MSWLLSAWITEEEEGVFIHVFEISTVAIRAEARWFQIKMKKSEKVLQCTH